MGTMIHAEPLELERDFLGRENDAGEPGAAA
jgi:hypothetical protein